MVRMGSLYSPVRLVPGRRVVHPVSADHRGHDRHLWKLLRGALEGIAIEDDEVGQLARNELSASALGSFEPGRCHAGRLDGLFDGDPLLGVPGWAVVQGA